ncbi:hypothetical protein CO674_35110 [Rhizobium hidalgonense]|uniref:Uncharacterized protein n=1 Tax=Rhizobium hidalgonense TaxID=1538159 RepID=A0ABX4JGB2_9HYPH|nr:hypothetical protein CO674_35110 [Rhizobium hidalgonense]PON03808.1 hypothetical protein ATY29_30300 [Rhizobium hidalgonense]
MGRGARVKPEDDGRWEDAIGKRRDARAIPAACGCVEVGVWRGVSTHSVIPGLEPGIHAASAALAVDAGKDRGHPIREPMYAECCVWIPGSRPGMTEDGVGLGENGNVMDPRVKPGQALG